MPAGGGEGGQNLIVGGGGPDTIYASQQVDGAEGGNGSILISGQTTLSRTALASVLSEWTSARTLQQKIANIQGVGTSTRNNGNYFLQVGVTVLKDSSVDQLFSDSKGDADWLFTTLGADIASRLKSTDTTTDLH